MADEQSPTVDFDVLFFDHLIKKEPKLVNKVYSAKRREELENERRSSGNFKPLVEVVAEYNQIRRKRSANSSAIKSPAAKKQLRQAEFADSSESSDSDENVIKMAAVKLFNGRGVKRSTKSTSDSSDAGPQKPSKIKVPLSQPKSVKKVDCSSDSESEREETIKAQVDRSDVQDLLTSKKGASISGSSENFAEMPLVQKPEVSSKPIHTKGPAPSKVNQSIKKVQAVETSDSSSDDSSDSDDELKKTSRPHLKTNISKNDMAKLPNHAVKKNVSNEASSDDSSDSEADVKNKKVFGKSGLVTDLAKISKEKASFVNDTSSDDSSDSVINTRKETNAKAEKMNAVAQSSAIKREQAIKKVAKRSGTSSESSSDNCKKASNVKTSTSLLLSSNITGKKVGGFNEMSSDDSSNSDNINEKAINNVMDLKRKTKTKNTAKNFEKVAETSSDDSVDDEKLKLKADLKMKPSNKLIISTPKQAVKNIAKIHKTSSSDSSDSSIDEEKVVKSNVNLKKNLINTSPAFQPKQAMKNIGKTNETSSDDSSEDEHKGSKVAKKSRNKFKSVFHSSLPAVKNIKNVAASGESSSDDSSDSEKPLKIKENLKTNLVNNSVSSAQKQTMKGIKKLSRTSSDDSSESSDNNGKTGKSNTGPKKNLGSSLLTSLPKSIEKQSSDDSSGSSEDHRNVMISNVDCSKKLVNTSKTSLSITKKVENSDETSSDFSSGDENKKSKVAGSGIKSSLSKIENLKKIVASSDSSSDDSSDNEKALEIKGGLRAKPVTSSLKSPTMCTTKKNEKLNETSSDDTTDSGIEKAAIKKNGIKIMSPDCSSVLAVNQNGKKVAVKSSDDSSDSDVGSGKNQNEKKVPAKSSSDDSSDSHVGSGNIATAKTIKKSFEHSKSSSEHELKQIVGPKETDPNSSDSSEDSSDDKAAKANTSNLSTSSGKKSEMLIKKANKSPPDSSSDSETSEIDEKVNIEGKNHMNGCVKSKSAELDKKSTDVSHGFGRKDGKRKFDDAARPSEETAHVSDDGERKITSGKAQKKDSGSQKVRNEPFRRVQITKDQLDEKFRDNSYKSEQDEWGKKAFEDFRKVQGKGFRHEKTKKKRGSYGGGAINTSSRSIKFDDSD